MSNELIEIPYETMSARAQWLRARMAESGQSGAAYKTLAVVILLLSIAAIVAAFAQAAMLILGGQAGSASEYFAISQANQLILQVALVTLATAGIPAFVLLALQPTHLLLTDEGLSFRAQGTPLRIGRKFIAWSSIEAIECIQRPGRAGDSLLIRGKGGQTMGIALANLSQEDRLRLLEAIKGHAPLAVQEPAVLAALTSSRDQTYTEIWLQAFASAPKRDSMIPLQAKAKVGKYQVEKQLGTGGFGTAYLAQTGSGQVVLKEFILPVYVDAAVCRQALKSFEGEARILKALDHPNIVKLLDFFVEDQRAYMVLEYVDGPSLKSLVEEKGALAEGLAVRYAMQVCDALKHLHEQAPPVVHRDVTPDNLILNSSGQLKLIDFNVAQQAGSGATAIFVGKPGYLPPEQFRGEPVEQSDIYAAGGTLHFLLTGQEPLALKVCHPRLVNSKVSIAADELVAKATALNAAERFAGAAQMKAALEDV